MKNKKRKPRTLNFAVVQRLHEALRLPVDSGDNSLPRTPNLLAVDQRLREVFRLLVDSEETAICQERKH